MKPVALDALAVVFSGNRQNPRHARHLPMKGRIEAGHLRQAGRPPRHGFDHGDFHGQMIGIEGADAPQFVEQLGRNPFGLRIALPPMNNPMPDGGKLAQAESLLEPIEQMAGRLAVAGGLDLTGALPASRQVVDAQRGLRLANAIDLARQQERRRIAGAKRV